MRRDQIQSLCERLRQGPSSADTAQAAKLLEDAYLGTGTAEAGYRLQVENQKMRDTLASVATEVRALRIIIGGDE